MILCVFLDIFIIIFTYLSPVFTSLFLAKYPLLFPFFLLDHCVLLFPITLLLPSVFTYCLTVLCVWLTGLIAFCQYWEEEHGWVAWA